ncbi:MAG: efflux transporter periplasmic adaptor subunit, partial [Desulfobacca sp.]|nr:efflux transporter periplasmic adaptor subunit [Desulfobacca sp.]
PKGEPTALVVDEADTVQQRMLTLNRTIGNQWLVSSGLKVGERVIVEGMMNVRPGVAVKVIPWNNPQAGVEVPNKKRPSAQSS